MKRVEDLLRECARRTGARCVPGFATHGLSFADLDAMSERLAGVLQAHGIAPEDRVAVFMDNSPGAMVAIFAALKVGAVFCPVDREADSERLAFVLNDCPAACLFVDARFAPVAAAAMAEAPLLRLVIVSGAEGAPAIDGILRFEDAVAAEPRPLASPGTALDPAMRFYPQQTAGYGASTAVTHGEIIDAASGFPGKPVGGGLFPPLLAVVAGMRVDSGELPGVAA